MCVWGGGEGEGGGNVECQVNLFAFTCNVKGGRNLSNIKYQTVKLQSHSWLKTSQKQLKLFLINAYVPRTISTQPTQTTL